jgi:hypothetical protein
MNESEMDPTSPTELTDQIAALRRQMITLLLALIVVSGTLTVYLWYQSRIAWQEAGVMRPQVLRMMSVFNQSSLVVEKLVIYGQAHPDFQPILKKYGIPPANSVAVNPAAKR